MSNPFVIRQNVDNMAKKGFTLIELLVVIAVIGVLMSLLLPAVQGAREAARRAQCMNNLHQIAIGILNYESHHRAYPPGNLNWPLPDQGTGGTMNSVPGHSFYMRILPYMDEDSVHDRLSYEPPRYGLKWYVMHHNNYYELRNQLFPWATCPSSSLPSIFYDRSGMPGEENQTFKFQISDYAGVSGSANKAEINPVTDAPMYKAYSGIIVDTRCLYQSKDLCIRKPIWVTQASVMDGTSLTIMLGEQSDWCMTPDREERDCRSCRMLHEGQKGNAHVNGGLRNMTTVLHPIDTKDATAIGAISGGANTPIQSAHPGGALTARADGSVHFQSANTELDVLYNLADRNDGQVLDLD